MNRPDPLTPEERELARLLGRPTTSAPPSEVDAAVLAAARAAITPEARTPIAPPSGQTTPSPVRTHRRRSRLPTILGIAASVVFAVGIAWQLNFHDPGLTPPPEAAPVAVEALPGQAAESASAPPPPAPAPPAAPVPRAAEPMPADDAAAPKAERSADAAPAKPMRPAPAVAPAAAPAPVTVEEVPAPAALMAPAPAAQERAELDRVEVTSSRVLGAPAASGRSASAPAAVRAQRAAPAAAKAAPSATFGALPTDEAVTAAVDADALLPRRQWIRRIRERRDAGDRDTARASLERYLQQYPEVRIPRDLRALLDD